MFRRKLCAGPSASVPPLKASFSPDARTIQVRLRNYSAVQREFFKSHADDLERCGIIYINPTATWASPPIQVSRLNKLVFISL